MTNKAKLSKEQRLQFLNLAKESGLLKEVIRISGIELLERIRVHQLSGKFTKHTYDVEEMAHLTARRLEKAIKDDKN